MRQIINYHIIVIIYKNNHSEGLPRQTLNRAFRLVQSPTNQALLNRPFPLTLLLPRQLAPMVGANVPPDGGGASSAAPQQRKRVSMGSLGPALALMGRKNSTSGISSSLCKWLLYVWMWLGRAYAV